MSDPLVSVVIPVRNGERFLAEAIASVLAQRYRPLELIVVDDGSSDQSAAIARAVPEVVCLSQAAQGVSVARNAGLACARGELIAFLDADDRWTPDKLSAQVGYLREHPDVQFVMSRMRYFVEPGCAIPPAFRRELLDGDRVSWLLSAFVGRRALFDRCGGFKSDLSTAEDVDWFARVKDRGVPFAVVEEVLLHARIHDRNTSLTAPRGRVKEDLLAALKRSVDRKRQANP
jgi:glycosyltransferase involved in cell wall biosynthesis